MNADQLLNDLGLTMGVPNLRFDEHGCARLMFDDKIAVNLEVDHDEGVLHLYAVLGPVPAENREATFLALLEGNLFGNRTRGATLAIDSLENEVVLCRTVSPDRFSGEAFGALVGDFVDTVESWADEINATPGAASADAPATLGGGHPGEMFIRG